MPAPVPRRNARGRFANLDPFEARSWEHMRKWRRERKASGWTPTGAPPPVTPASREVLAAPAGPSITWVGHATTLVHLDGANFLTDPVWGAAGWGAVRRAAPPGVRFGDLPELAAVLVSHNHPDHLDGPTFLRLPRRTPILCPQGLGGWFRRRLFRDVREVPWWGSARVGGVEITAVPAQHWSRRGLFDEGASHWCGWMLDGEKRVYFAGDTAYFSGFQRIAERGRPHAAILPIGAYEPRWFMQVVHMNPEEAVAAARDLGARQLVPMHWGTFRLTDEPLDEPPRRVADAWREADLPTSGLAVLPLGGSARVQ